MRDCGIKVILWILRRNEFGISLGRSCLKVEGKVCTIITIIYHILGISEANVKYPCLKHPFRLNERISV